MWGCEKGKKRADRVRGEQWKTTHSSVGTARGARI